MIKHVTFVNPPSLDARESFTREGRCTQKSNIWSFVYPPYSLVSCGSLLQKNGVYVRVLDYSVESRTREAALIECTESTDLVMVNVGSASLEGDIAFVRCLKKQNKNIVIGILGAHMGANANVYLDTVPEIDFIIVGEPEFALLKFIKEFDSKGGQSIISERIQNLDELPFPNWDLVDMNKYKNPLTGKNVFMVVPQRGCSWKCSYCTAPLYYGALFRYRSVENIKSELVHLSTKYKDFEVLFWADTFTVNKNFVRNVCRAIEPLHIPWMANSRGDTLDLDLVRVMEKSGCKIIAIGIESGAQGVLDQNRKQLNILKTKKRILEIKEKSNISIVGHFILGLPGETRSTLEATYSFVKEVPLDYAQFYYATPFPGTEVYEKLKKNVGDDLSFKSFSQDKPEFQLSNISLYDLTSFRRKLIITTLFRFQTIRFILKTVKLRAVLRGLNTFRKKQKWLEA